MSKKTRTQFDAIEMAELEAKQCEMLTPYQGSKGDLSFCINQKSGNIIVDHYIMRNGKIMNIMSDEVTFDDLIAKL